MREQVLKSVASKLKGWAVQRMPMESIRISAGSSVLTEDSRMTAMNQASGITRRGFFKQGAEVLATIGILAGVSHSGRIPSRPYLPGA
jgi:hypothetical protein